MKGLERLERERIKREKEAEKEEERLRKKVEKEAEAKKKEEEKLRAEEAENEKKKRTAEAFKQFFVKKSSEAGEPELGGASGAVDEFKFEERKVGAGGGVGSVGSNFTPFQVKKNMRLAPSIR